MWAVKKRFLFYVNSLEKKKEVGGGDEEERHLDLFTPRI